MAVVAVRAKSQGDQVVTSIADEFAKKPTKENEKTRKYIFFFLRTEKNGLFKYAPNN
jgi:hypothetical protein